MTWLYRPAPLSKRTQAFGANATDLYASQGFKGHYSEDYAFTYGQPVQCCADGLVYSTLNKENPDPDRYRAVCTLVEANGKLYEVIYGHFKDIYVTAGQKVYAGDIIGTAGNTGTVYSQGRLVTKAEKLGGSTAGTHLHGPQVRPVELVSIPTGNMLLDGNGLLKYKGQYVKIIDPDNGFAGCVNPEPFYNGKLALDALKERLSLFQMLLSLMKKLGMK
jgi:murein DD-endopeptidase MepM/ murein hydrolase activator NlpD